MASAMIKDALNIVYTYLSQKFAKKDLTKLCGALNKITEVTGHDYKKVNELITCSYEDVQDILSSINEKESIRKTKGVYYTPFDVVEFMLCNSIKASVNELKSATLHLLDLNGVPYKEICVEKNIFDPTCGTGVFLLAALNIKFDLLDTNIKNVTNLMVKNVIATIHGNDVNPESIAITKIRLYLATLYRYGISKTAGIEEILNCSFSSYDFVQKSVNRKEKYDIVIGNPPYVEDTKSGLDPVKKYGNIYANVLKNSAEMLLDGGVFAFIIPLSYISTPRMQAIRDDLFELVPEQYIMSYSDRPDCLFASVHQKLCILLAAKKHCPRKIYTSSYQYWYKENRDNLFLSTKVVKNEFVRSKYIPKLGNEKDVSIYKKILALNKNPSLYDMNKVGDGHLFLNMRATFWVKAFLREHRGSEYRDCQYQSADDANYAMCLYNSSLFWWYWVCVSDCWHITKKELVGFHVPVIRNYEIVNQLAWLLENQLENTKEYVGTKQIEYEYKHKKCIDVIHKVDDFINNLFDLTNAESEYIKNFAYRFRVGGGAEVAKRKSD